MLARTPNAKHGRRNVHFRHTKRHVSPSKLYPTALSHAAKLLQFDSDVDLAKWLGPPATRHSVKAWRRGLRTTPPWVLDKLATAQQAFQVRVSTLGEWIARAKKEAAMTAS